MITAADQHWMRHAVAQARQCLRKPPLVSDVPIGAVCVRDNTLISAAHNRRELANDPAGHAEILALQKAARAVGWWQLPDVTLYVTLEPCPMCAGAIWGARLHRVVFGAWDRKAGACGSLYDIPRDPRLNHQPQLRGGVLEQECKDILQEFFQNKRR